VRKTWPKGKVSLLPRQTVLEDAAKYLLVEGGETRDCSEDAVATEFAPIPVATEISDDGAEPGGKARQTLGMEAPEPPEPMPAQLLTHIEETLGDLVRVPFKQPHDLQNREGVTLQEFCPRRLRATGA
jgi:hypothetical protein